MNILIFCKTCVFYSSERIITSFFIFFLLMTMLKHKGIKKG